MRVRNPDGSTGEVAYDREAQAMEKVVNALNLLGDDQKAVDRVLRWARERFLGRKAPAQGSEESDD